MTTNFIPFKFLLPKRLKDNYYTIRSIHKNEITDELIDEIERLINDSLPDLQDDKELVLKTMNQYLYRKNPNEYYRFLMKSKLFHLVLWTEAKSIVKHFNFNNKIHIKWNGSYYECNRFIKNNSSLNQDESAENYNAETSVNQIKSDNILPDQYNSHKSWSEESFVTKLTI